MDSLDLIPGSVLGLKVVALRIKMPRQGRVLIRLVCAASRAWRAAAIDATTLAAAIINIVKTDMLDENDADRELSALAMALANDEVRMERLSD